MNGNDIHRRDCILLTKQLVKNTTLGKFYPTISFLSGDNMVDHNKNIVVIGDGYVGKTSILHAIQRLDFQEQIPNL